MLNQLSDLKRPISIGLFIVLHISSIICIVFTGQAALIIFSCLLPSCSYFFSKQQVNHFVTEITDRGKMKNFVIYYIDAMPLFKPIVVTSLLKLN